MKPIRIYRHRQSDSFTSLPNALLQNESLSWGARGLLVYLLSLPQDWTIHMSDVMARGLEGKQRFYALRRELEAAGYLRGRIDRDARGVIKAHVWEVSDTATYFDQVATADHEPEMPIEQPAASCPVSDFPDSGQPDSGFPESGKPESGKPESGNPPTTKETITNNTRTKDTPTKARVGEPVLTHQSSQATVEQSVVQQPAQFDPVALRFQQLPWESTVGKADQGFVEFMVRVLPPKDDAAAALRTATSYIRKARQNEDRYQAVMDDWEQYQADLQRKREIEEAKAKAEAAEAERRKWLGRPYGC